MSLKAINHILFGAAYYDEYMPYDRLNRDIEMMKRAHINVVRIGESTWSTIEPQPGKFDFSHIDRVIDAMGKASIDVIVGTPSYAIPSWLAGMYPDMLVTTHKGKQKYGRRQIMNIVHPAYRYYAERMIRELLKHVAKQPNVIGFQIDNETKHYDVVSADVQRLFVKWLRNEFDNDLVRLNQEMGLDYWANRIDAWEDFPDITQSINGSLISAYQRFLRELVTDFLHWQADIVRQYTRSDQFVTQNFDLEWQGYSFGMQSQADDFASARFLDIAGVDVYHPSEDSLTGKEIAFGGDLARSFKRDNYLLLETQAQGQNGWLPYPGQLRLQGYSHLASGSDSIMYWHWHSIHNSYETYWKGLLSHDFEPNPTYEEASALGEELSACGDALLHLSKKNKVAIVVNNASLTALQQFAIVSGFPDKREYDTSNHDEGYNDILRWIYDVLYNLNVECDFVTDDADDELLSTYSLLVIPALYSTTDSFVRRIQHYVFMGGKVLATFRSFVADEYLKVWPDSQPHGLTDVFGMEYRQFTLPENVGLRWSNKVDMDTKEMSVSKSSVSLFIELLIPSDSNDSLASYEHSAWTTYSAVTEHKYGTGMAWWLGGKLDSNSMKILMQRVLKVSELWGWKQELSEQVTVRSGINLKGRMLHYFFNYSGQMAHFLSPLSGNNLIASFQNGGAVPVHKGMEVAIQPWDLLIIEAR